jgi:hypothetical protein
VHSSAERRRSHQSMARFTTLSSLQVLKVSNSPVFSFHDGGWPQTLGTIHSA